MIFGPNDYFQDNNNWDGCHYNQNLPCYKNEFECEVAMTSVSSGTRLQIISNGVPDHSAWAMTGQTSIITEKNYAFRVPKVPVLLPLNQATDANQGAVGYATNGVAIFGPYNSGCCDATFEEIQTVDYCLGHPANGAYHYHYFSKENFIILILLPVYFRFDIQKMNVGLTRKLVL